MKYNQNIHHRRTIRLQHYDYSTTGAYFITICIFERECLLGDVVDGEMRLNGAGHIVDESWQQIVTHFTGVNIDQYIIMPNHFHGIITTVGAGFPRPKTGVNTQGGETPPLRRATLGQIVGYFKYQSTKHINQLRNNPGVPVWQRNYYERVIRNDHELQSIQKYIVDNPKKWQEDENHPSNL